MNTNIIDNDIFYFIKHIMKIELLPYQEILIKKLIDARNNNETLIFLPGRIYGRKMLNTIFHEYELYKENKQLGYNTSITICDELDRYQNQT